MTWTVRNSGNVRLAGHQHVSVQAPFGWTMTTQAADDVPELLPGSSVSYSAHLTGVLPTFRVTGVVTLEPFSRAGDLDPAPQPATGSSSVWAIPWLWLVALALVVGLIVVAGPGGPSPAPPAAQPTGEPAGRPPGEPGDAGRPVTRARREPGWRGSARSRPRPAR